LSADTLQWIAAEFARADDVWVVGAYSRPAQTYEANRYYWNAQNKARFLESDAFASSIVVAPCYAFRRKLLDGFPPDVVADDIYVAFLANTSGYRTVYSRKAMALEVRTANTLLEFVPHKFRKSNAFLKESLRFLYRLPEMNTLCKVILLTRTAQQLLLPWMLLWWILIAGALLTLFRLDVVFFGTTFLAILVALTNRVFASVELPGDQSTFTLITVIKGYILTILILLATGFSYPFFRQGSSYSRFISVPPAVDQVPQPAETENSDE
jgi:cellulose synthase/poly-beta-1,6-N-acetylglucosamine synthase-like glycosyltransferase